MGTTRKRSNVVTKALLITALASGIAGMQAQPASADNTVYKGFYRLSENNLCTILGYTSTLSKINLCIANSDFDITVGYNSWAKTYTIKKGELYFDSSTEDTEYEPDRWLTVLGDAKSILGSSSSGLSEEQKTIVKNLIANWPRFFRLVEKFFERNDDYNEYDKKT